MSKVKSVVVKTDGSDAVDAVEYFPTEKQLIVKWRGNNSPYMYPGVPVATFSELLRADSVGNFMNTRIKPNFEAFRKVK